MTDNPNIQLIQNADLKGKVVLVRVDHNVVKKGLIHDPYRIDSTIATLFHIASKGGKIILMTHVGRPYDKKTGEYKIDDSSSVQPIVEYLKTKLQISVKTPEYVVNGTKGISLKEDSIKQLLAELKSDKLDAIYLPNTRWFEGEESKGEAAEQFAKMLAGLGDVFVNDAFGSWQAHASTVRVNKLLPSYAGLLMQKELLNLDRIYKPAKPFVSVVAGSKFDTKIESLNTLLKDSDQLVLGGVIYNAYLCAKYGIQIQGITEEDLVPARQFVEFAAKFPGKLVELPYIVESDVLEGKVEGQYRVRKVADLKPGTQLNFVLDAAEESFADPKVIEVFQNAKTIFVNAVMGYTPHFNNGTVAMYTLIDKNKGALKLYGGGDTIQELKRLLPGLYMPAVDNPKYYFFTGGGAVLKAVQEGTLSGIEPVKALMAK